MNQCIKGLAICFIPFVPLFLRIDMNIVLGVSFICFAIGVYFIITCKDCAQVKSDGKNKNIS